MSLAFKSEHKIYNKLRVFFKSAQTGLLISINSQAIDKFVLGLESEAQVLYNWKTYVNVITKTLFIYFKSDLVSILVAYLRQQYFKITLLGCGNDALSPNYKYLPGAI